MKNADEMLLKFTFEWAVFLHPGKGRFLRLEPEPNRWNRTRNSPVLALIKNRTVPDIWEPKFDWNRGTEPNGSVRTECPAGAVIVEEVEQQRLWARWRGREYGYGGRGFLFFFFKVGRAG
jgi:hypothetical protein